MTIRLSVIVPALNEAREIAATLEPLQPLRNSDYEIIVADGASVDATAMIAAPLADIVSIGPRGRAKQMNAAAAVASGAVLLFLHADSRLAPAAIDAITGQLAATRRRWGRFDVAIDGRSRWLPLIAFAMNVRSRLSGIATGDQAMFVERALFDRAGGFPDQPLMEDIELSRRLKRVAGRPLRARGPVRTSGRRWDANGAWRTIVAMWRLRFDYWRGAEASSLARRYAAMPARRRLRTLQIFTKAPIPGAVKTRLAVTEGAGAAASIHRMLVERTLGVAQAAREAAIVDAVELWCAPDASAPGFVEWAERFAVVPRAQCDGDLGARMRHAIATATARGERAIVIGTDCAELTVDYLRAAVVALDDHDAVLGPAEDGGYVLVGLGRDADIFSDIPWSTGNVTSATRARLRAAGLRWHELPTLWDVDRPEDLARWRASERPSFSSS